MTRDPRYAWLALSRISGIGRVLYRRLIDRFGAPSGVFQSDRRELLAVEGLREQTARNILNFKGEDAVKAGDRGLGQAEDPPAYPEGSPLSTPVGRNS